MVNFQKLYEMQQNGIVTDCTVKMGDNIRKVHSIIMYAGTDYFKNIMKGSKYEKHVFADLTGLVDPKTFDKIIRYIYLSEIELNEDNFAQISRAADLLQMKELRELCSIIRSSRL